MPGAIREKESEMKDVFLTALTIVSSMIVVIAAITAGVNAVQTHNRNIADELLADCAARTGEAEDVCKQITVGGYDGIIVGLRDKNGL